ncbi:MAG: T9SS type A sorting domain-containing protein [Flavobacteriales bacterium]
MEAPSEPVHGYYDDGRDMDVEFYVKNRSSSDREVKVVRRVIDTVEGSEDRFCWSSECWSTARDTSNTVRTISGNGGVDSSFKASYSPNGHRGTATIEYCFYDIANASDPVCTLVHYEAKSSISIEEKGSTEKARIKLSPNPARERLNVKLEAPVKGTLRLHSILGEIALKRKVKGNDKELELDVRGLNEGLHFLTFEGANGRSVTRKVMIRN